MKLRMRGSSVRLRLTRGEVGAIGNGERVEEVVAFAPGKRLIYALECGGDAVLAAFDQGQVVVRLPLAVAREWSTSDRVSIEAAQRVDASTELRILIEKDFACLTHREGEEDADAFPNPGHCG
jgi:hypothetical protein